MAVPFAFHPPASNTPEEQPQSQRISIPRANKRAKSSKVNVKGEIAMSIANVVVRGCFAYVYDEKGRQVSIISAGGSGPGDGLVGYTSSTVNIKRGPYVYTYNERGSQIAITSAR